MMNPDGVVCGNYRSNIFGQDLNRQFKKNINQNLFPEVTGLLDLIKSYKE